MQISEEQDSCRLNTNKGYKKTPLEVSQLIERLKEKGLEITDEEKAKKTSYHDRISPIKKIL